MKSTSIQQSLRALSRCAVLGCGLALALSSQSRADVIADSKADFTTIGLQGDKNWFSGMYNLSLDSDGTYSAGEFVPFTNSAGPGGGPVTVNGNHWTGGQWQIHDFSDNQGPWNYISNEGLHPNGTNSLPNQEIWSIRRWVAPTTAPLALNWITKKENLNGSGVTGALYVNGTQVDTATIAGNDGVGVNRTYYANIHAGDVVDLALTPRGADTGDGADGSRNQLIINNTIPAGAVNKLSLANSVTQFSDVQGQNNWFYGKYDQRAAITANGGNVNTPYDPELFEPFSHTPGDNTVSPTNQWDGTKWDEAVNVAPWTELSAGGGHPAANGQGDPNVEWAVRRWVAPDDVDGEVEVKGNFTHQNVSAADGDVGRIFLNGTEVFNQVTANAAAPFDLILDIHPGDILDFAADADGAGNLLTGGLIAISDGSDGFNFSAQITLDVPFSPIPEPSSIILAGLGLVGLLGWTWRRKR